MLGVRSLVGVEPRVVELLRSSHPKHRGAGQGRQHQSVRRN